MVIEFFNSASISVTNGINPDIAATIYEGIISEGNLWRNYLTIIHCLIIYLAIPYFYLFIDF